MDKNLSSYLKVYENFLGDELCKETVQSLDQLLWKKHSYSNPNGTSYTYENDLSVATPATIDMNQKFNQKIWDVLYQYVVKDMKDCSEWFNSWQGFAGVRFNKYDPTTEMRLHCDHIHTLFDGTRKGVPILTVLGTLNKDYTGGEFIMWEDEVIDIPVGAIAVFPSSFLFPHEVRPVKSGARYSYVSWAW